MFKNVTQNKNVYATFIEESKMGEIIVNHYKTDTTEEVADKQIIRGNINDKYVTNPKAYIANYSLNTEKLPVNATGKITNETTQVTYYYNENPVKIVTSYINIETNEYMQDDNIQYKNIGEEYETQGMENIPDGYELFKEPEKYKAVEGGESIEKLFERTGDFLRNVVEPQLEDGKNIVIIGHGAMNSGIICQVRGLSTEHFWDAGINQCELLQLK